MLVIAGDEQRRGLSTLARNSLKSCRFSLLDQGRVRLDLPAGGDVVDGVGAVVGKAAIGLAEPFGKQT